MIDKDYLKGWRYIVWVGGVDNYYTTYEKAKKDCDEWISKDYDQVKIEKLKKEKDAR